MDETARDISDKEKKCCSAPGHQENAGLSAHWDKTYQNNPEEKLGWHETYPGETICLVEKCDLPPDSVILVVGAGTTTLIEFLLLMGYEHIIATDISSAGLDKLKRRLGDESRKVQFIVDDLTRPALLNKIDAVDLWIDRAVLHFFTQQRDRETYFDLVRSSVSEGGFAIFGEYHHQGVKRCAGLPVYGYSAAMLTSHLGKNFDIICHFDHLFLTPSGDERRYIYALFEKNK